MKPGTCDDTLHHAAAPPVRLGVINWIISCVLLTPVSAHSRSQSISIETTLRACVRVRCDALEWGGLLPSGVGRHRPPTPDAARRRPPPTLKEANSARARSRSRTRACISALRSRLRERCSAKAFCISLTDCLAFAHISSAKPCRLLSVSLI
eukprot:scaffold53920_cov31-Tisochrysis_lutea.AAC.1